MWLSSDGASGREVLEATELASSLLGHLVDHDGAIGIDRVETHPGPAIESVGVKSTDVLAPVEWDDIGVAGTDLDDGLTLPGGDGNRLPGVVQGHCPDMRPVDTAAVRLHDLEVLGRLPGLPCFVVVTLDRDDPPVTQHHPVLVAHHRDTGEAATFGGVHRDRRTSHDGRDPSLALSHALIVDLLGLDHSLGTGLGSRLGPTLTDCSSDDPLDLREERFEIHRVSNEELELDERRYWPAAFVGLTTGGIAHRTPLGQILERDHLVNETVIEVDDAIVVLVLQAEERGVGPGETGLVEVPEDLARLALHLGRPVLFVRSGVETA